MASSKRSPSMDTCYSWLIFVSSFMVTFVALGQLLTFGIYFIVLEDYFRLDKKSTGLIGAVCFTVANCVGPVAGVLQRRYGARPVVMTGGVIASLGMIASYFARDYWHLYISYGLLVGLGYGLAVNPAVSILPEYFEKHRYLVTTLLSIGGSLGTLVLAPFTLYIVETYTWRGSMLINAGLCLQLLIFGSVMKSRLIDRNASVRELLKVSVFKDPRYVMLLFDGAMIGGAGFVVFATITTLTTGRGLTTWESATLVSVTSLSTTLSRILAAFMSSMKWVDRLAVYTFVSLTGSAGVFGCVFAYDFWSFAVCLFVFGFSFGIKVSQVINVIIDLVGVHGIAVGIGYFMFAIGIGGFILPLLAGWIADQTSAEYAFVFMGISILFGFLCCCVILILRRMHKKKMTTLDQAVVDAEKDALNNGEGVLAPVIMD